jgi:hypothetical protein
VKHYNDTNNWTISPADGGSSSVLRGFSTSQIGGALGDSGQVARHSCSTPIASHAQPAAEL